MRIFGRLVKPLCLCKARKIGQHCNRYISGKVLDVGAGRCLIAKELHEKYNTDITCIDIADLNETDMKLIVYDGKKIPFPDSKFDTILIVYVLHHCENPVKVLKECKRVCKNGGSIIIFEDFGFILVSALFDILANKMHNVNTPLNFKSVGEWKKIFSGLGMKIERIENGVERQVFYPFVEHKMFVLKVNK